MQAYALFYSIWSFFKKNYPLRSEKDTILVSWRVTLFTPLKTIFFEISTPRGPRPLKNMLHLLYFATASIPIAQIYLDHLSFTSSFSISISYPSPFWIFWMTEVSSGSTSFRILCKLGFKNYCSYYLISGLINSFYLFFY